MDNASKYYLVDASVLPKVFTKVIEVKRILESGAIKNVNEAVKRIGISRSAYYKYKDFVFPFYETSRGKVITLFFTVEDCPGILSGIMNKIADSRASIVTINQNIPINGFAYITITVETGEMVTDIKNLLVEISKVKGVRSQEILSRE
ncbi:ACT domain-containing protein [Herbivorax sp. ANBcel31]|uniref:ACT domain-containing protein n=1 Tax=Herbivorax sp. ANBcel31 TaxID=3069754 RepID=UPI0027B49685|nr:ACT domain-containing protein [Herbivorax sp. ANBcel31]MDQ2085505.1 ACT domain-containing protein [Herbivorax sp. ANBcel31]